MDYGPALPVRIPWNGSGDPPADGKFKPAGTARATGTSTPGGTMDPLRQTTASLLARHPSPALPIEVVRDLLAHESPSATPDTESLLARLHDPAGTVRVLRRPRRRWLAPIGPRAWILAPLMGECMDHPSRSILGRMRASLQRMAGAVEPESSQAWARWTRMLHEEARIRSIMERATGRLGGQMSSVLRPGTPQSTTPLPDPRPRARIRTPAQRPPAPATPPRGFR